MRPFDLAVVDLAKDPSVRGSLARSTTRYPKSKPPQSTGPLLSYSLTAVPFPGSGRELQLRRFLPIIDEVESCFPFSTIVQPIANLMKLPLIVYLTCFCAGAATVSLQQDEVKPRPVKRAARPVYSERDWDGVFFSNLFEQGLVGDRPDPATTIAAQPGMQATAAATEVAPANGAWSSLIGRDVLENEIKRIQIDLETQITTPVRFNTGYKDVQHSFIMLATWFAVIQQYDADVRWKDVAGEVVAGANRAAINARSPGDNSFRYSVQIRQCLTDLVRGGNFGGPEKAVDAVAWEETADRTVMMNRINALFDEIKQSTANESSFNDEVEENLNRASLIAAMARVLAQPGMNLADDQGYVALAKSMETAATSLVQSVKTPNLAAAQAATNQIDQSCSNCHGEWR